MKSRSLIRAVKEEMTVVNATFRVKVRMFRHDLSSLIGDITIAVFFVLIPVFLAITAAGTVDEAANRFYLRTGSRDWVGYLVLGSAIIGLVSETVFTFALWIHGEMVTGTIDSIILTPARRLSIFTGMALYVYLRGLISFFIAIVTGLIMGQLITGQWILTSSTIGSILIALVILILGLISLGGTCLVINALVITTKEPNSLITLSMWSLIWLAGMTFPITVMPPLLQLLAELIPVTWQLNGIRATLTGTKWLLGNAANDITVLIFFAVAGLLFGLTIYSRAERALRENPTI